MSAAQHGTAPRQSCLTDDNDIIIIIVAARLRRVVVLLLLLLLLFSVASAHCAAGEGRAGEEGGQRRWPNRFIVLPGDGVADK